MPEDKVSFGRLFKQIHLAFEANRTMRIKEIHMTPAQMDILGVLWMERDREMTQKDLETVLRLSNPTVTGLLNRMEEKDLIRRVKKEEDKRCRVIQMTQQSKDFIERLQSERKRGEDNIVKNMTEAEQAELARLLKIVLSNLTESEQEASD